MGLKLWPNAGYTATTARLPQVTCLSDVFDGLGDFKPVLFWVLTLRNLTCHPERFFAKGLSVANPGFFGPKGLLMTCGYVIPIAGRARRDGLLRMTLRKVS